MRGVFFLSCGRFDVPALGIRPPGQRQGRARMTNTVGVAVRDDGSVVLVDAGWSAATCADAAGSLGLVRTRSLGVRVRPGDAVVEQLAEQGIEPARVKAIVATHLHLDHVGGLEDFPDAELVVTGRELDAYRAWPRHFGYRAADMARAGRIRAVELDGGPTYGFPASADVYGDGQIVMLDARGHTRGSVAVALRGEATYVHIGDCAYQRWEYGLSPAGPGLVARITAWKPQALARTYESLRACEADPRRPVLVPSHDAEVFDALPKAPAIG